MAKKIESDELDALIKMTKPAISLNLLPHSYSSLGPWPTLYTNANEVSISGMELNRVERKGNYSCYTKEHIKNILEHHPGEFRQMLIDGVEFELEDILNVIDRCGSTAATALLEATDIEIPIEVAHKILKLVSMPYSSYIKKFIPRLMMPYNEMVEVNFLMGTMLDLSLYICDPAILNTANDKLLFWIFKDPKFSDKYAEKANDYVKKMYKKYKLTLKFMDIDEEKDCSLIYATYDIKKDVELYNEVFGSDEDEEE